MAVDFRILPDQGLAFVRYSGVVALDDTMAAFSAFLQDPRAGTAHRHFVDFKDVTGIAFDATGLLRMQAKKVERLAMGPRETLMAYYCTRPDTLKLAQLAQRSWEGLGQVIVRTFDDEAAAKAFLGIPDLNIAALRVIAAND